jgi:hypothetical protein
MTVFFDTIIAFLAAIGFISLLWMILGIWGRGHSQPIYLEAPDADFEAAVKAARDIRWLCLWGVADIHFHLPAVTRE